MRKLRSSALAVALVAPLSACGSSASPSFAADDAGDAADATSDAATDAPFDAEVSETLDAAETGACIVPTPTAPGSIATDRGVVVGAREGTTWSYKAIPYAAPPTGALRWTPPQPAACWTTPLQASAFGPICPQSDSAGTGPVTGNEDCLQLNVWVPDAGSAPHATLVFIHGGGHVGGSAADQQLGTYIFDGAALAAKTGSIVVTLNYRLGALGFLAHPLLTAEGGGASGDYGMLDQIAALGWVHRNVGAFGGDASRVMIFGESAGAQSVCSLVASPLAKGLFSAALMESGACTAKTLSDAETFGKTVFVAAKCDTAADPLACMRALSAVAVVSALPSPVDIAGKPTDYDAVVEGKALTGIPLDVITAGAHNHVPMIVGSNSDETSRAVPAITDEAQYEAAVDALFPTLAIAEQVITEYPSSDFASPRAAFVAVTTDAKFVCTTRRVLRALAKGQSQAMYRYFYTHGYEASATLAPFGAWHGAELPFVFQDIGLGGYSPTAAERALADAIDGYWGRFGATGDPNGVGAVAWPKWDSSDGYLGLDDTIVAGHGVRTARCDFWDSLQ